MNGINGSLACRFEVDGCLEMTCEALGINPVNTIYGFLRMCSVDRFPKYDFVLATASTTGWELIRRPMNLSAVIRDALSDPNTVLQENNRGCSDSVCTELVSFKTDAADQNNTIRAVKDYLESLRFPNPTPPKPNTIRTISFVVLSAAILTCFVVLAGKIFDRQTQANLGRGVINGDEITVSIPLLPFL